MEFLAQAVQSALSPVWAGRPRSNDVAEPALFDDDTNAMIESYIGVRESIVSGLVAEVHEVLKPTDVELCFIDHAGAMPHVMLGVDADQPVTDSSRKLGVDLLRVARASDEITVLGYVDTPERLRSLLGRYREVLGAEANLSVALRPLLPDCEDPSVLVAKVEAAARAGATRVDFYHYAMMPLDRLDWISAALSAARNITSSGTGDGAKWS